MSVAFLEFRLVHEKNDQWVSELFADGKAPEGFKIGSAQDQFYVRDYDSVSNEQMDRAYWTAQRKFAAKPRSELCSCATSVTEHQLSSALYRDAPSVDR